MAKVKHNCPLNSANLGCANYGGNNHHQVFVTVVFFIAVKEIWPSPLAKLFKLHQLQQVIKSPEATNQTQDIILIPPCLIVDMKSLF